MKRFLSLCMLFALAAMLLCGCTGGKTIPYEQNLIQNGDVFAPDESGMPSSWDYVAYENNAAVALADVQDNAAHLVHYAANDSRFVQHVPTQKNTIYRIEAWIKACGVSGKDYGAGVAIENTFITSVQLYDTQDQWTPVTLYVDSADQTQLGVELRLGYFSNDATGEAWFKDVSVCAVQSAPSGAAIYTYQAYDASGQDASGDASHLDLFASVGAFLMLLFAPVLAHLLGKKNGQEAFSVLPGSLAWLTAGTALLVRLILSVLVHGYEVDINCFTAWSEHVFAVGPMQFYETISFCDYPPGYLYILWIVALLRRIFGISTGSILYLALLKLPAIVCDVVVGLVFIRAFEKKIGAKNALVAACIYWFNPAVLINSACWGQIDAVVVLGLSFMILFLLEKKMLPASVSFALSVLMKPQALMAGPLLLVGFIAYIMEDRKRGLKELGADFLICAAICVGAVLPFFGNQHPTWILEKYFSTLSSYGYASVNAMNLFGLLDANWVEQTTVLFAGITYQHLGTALMILVILYAAAIFIKKREMHALPVCAALIFCGVFVLGVRMHERYLFPALMMLLLAWGSYRDVRLIFCFAVFSAAQFINIALPLANGHLLTAHRWQVVVFSLVNLLGFAYLAYIAWEICVCGKCVLALNASEKKPTEHKAKTASMIPVAPQRERITRFDVLAMSIVTLVYGVFSLINLGDMHAPISTYTSTANQERATFAFDEPFELSQFYFYGGIGEGALFLEYSSDGESWSPMLLSADDRASYSEGKLTYALNTMFEWHVFEVYPVQVSKVRLTFESAGISIIELGFKDAQGLVHTPGSAVTEDARIESYDPMVMADEQQEVPERPSYMNSMYFDEIYHARTAYEHINGMEWYETTHPPLGKALMSLCILALGMNPFAWRLAGALAGIFMLPGIYLTAKLLFGRSKIALAAMLLLTFDCMHFAQTRIATIDSFVVLFIIWMYYFMLRYVFLHNFNREPLKKTFPSLLLSGVMMGLGIASKWTGVYAGAGLAVIFFYTLYLRYKECAVASDSKEKEEALRLYPNKALITCAFCVLAFVIIPIAIYMLSYTQYFMIRGGKSLSQWWQAQMYMFQYHAGLTESHYFASPWYEWPLMIRPMWYYKGNHDGLIATINAMGNPVVWWTGLAALLCLAYKKAIGTARNFSSAFILIGFAAQFAPWVLVTRATFIYHYFTCVPFIILAIGYMANLQYDRAQKKKQRDLDLILFGFVALALLLFVFFYPAVSGVDMTAQYAKLLKWMPTWTIWAY